MSIKQAAVEGRTVYQKSIKGDEYEGRVLKPSSNTKLGKVMRKIWPDAKIFTLTLEERKTCPSDCAMWNTCYGNNMPFAHRMGMSARILMGKIEEEIKAHKGTMAIRLHVLGDFFSTEYVAFWDYILTTYPHVRVWGYTANQPRSYIGEAVQYVARRYPTRWVVRFSNQAEPIDGVLVCKVGGDEDGFITCPEQLGKVESCGDCGLCMNPKVKRGIRFLEH